MRHFFKKFLYVLVFLSFTNGVYSLSDNQIKEICKKYSSRSICIKNLKFKRFNLFQGNRIEIPVIPFKK